METYATTMSLLLVFISLIQPCPAPPIAVFGVIAGAADAAGAAGAAVAGAAGAVGGAVAGAVGSASAGAAGAAVLSGVAAGATTAGIDHIHKRGFRFDKRTSSNNTSSDIFTTCIADTPGASSKAYLLVGNDTIVINGTAQRWAMVNGVPASCIAQIDSYNTHPNIVQLNSMHGTTTVVNDTAILLTDLSESHLAYFRTLVKT